MFNVGLIKSILTQSTIKGVRSTILRPLAWMMGILLSATVIVVVLQSPFWFQIILSIFLVLSILLYLFTYILCLFTDKDALRSENFTISKLAIEKGIIGDNITGILRLSKEEAKLIEEKSLAESKEEE